MALILPPGYKPVPYPTKTHRAIRKVKGYFRDEPACHLKLQRLSAPLIILP